VHGCPEDVWIKAGTDAEIGCVSWRSVVLLANVENRSLCQLEGVWGVEGRDSLAGGWQFLCFEVDFQVNAAYLGLTKGCPSLVGRLAGRLVVCVDQPWLPSRSVTVSPLVERGLLLAS
jgi:hypothetical protein